MSYYFSRKLEISFEEALEKVVSELGKEGFGVLTEIDVQKALKEKLAVDYQKYKILGACIPSLAYEALKVEDKIGAMLPCNVIVQEQKNDTVEVSAVDPVASMKAIDNPALREIASQARKKLKRVINAL